MHLRFKIVKLLFWMVLISDASLANTNIKLGCWSPDDEISDNINDSMFKFEAGGVVKNLRIQRYMASSSIWGAGRVEFLVNTVLLWDSKKGYSWNDIVVNRPGYRDIIGSAKIRIRQLTENQLSLTINAMSNGVVLDVVVNTLYKRVDCG